MGRSHVATGATAGAALAAAAPAPAPLALAAGAVCAYAALLPDLDHPRSAATLSAGPATMLLSWLMRGCPRRWLVAGRWWHGTAVAYPWGLTHRGATHDARIGPPTAAAATAAVTWPLPAPLGGHWWLWAAAVGLGCLTHVWADARTTSGVPHPLGRRDARGRPLRFTVGRTFTTGSPTERRLLVRIYARTAVAAWLAAAYLIAA